MKLFDGNRAVFFLQATRGAIVAGSVIVSVSVRELTELQIEVFGVSWYYLAAMTKGLSGYNFEFLQHSVFIFVRLKLHLRFQQ